MSAGAARWAARSMAVGALLTPLGACSEGHAGNDAPTAVGSIGAAAAAIVGGTIDSARPDVLLLRDDTLAGFRCTATLIAPNLVITARHCVGSRAAGTTLCRGGATDDGAAALPNYQGDVEAAPMYFSRSPGSPLLARGAAIYDDGSTTTCGHDVALIGLDRAVAGISPSPLRRAPLAQGDSLVVMGFGWTDRNATVNASERMKAEVSVLALGPLVYSFKPFGDAMATADAVAIAAGEVSVTGVTMTGDSGGPAFDSAGRLAALVSRGYGDAYYGPGTLTSIAAHLAIIDAALTATGNSPVADAGLDAAGVAPGDRGEPSATPPAARPATDGGAADGTSEGSPGGCSATGHRAASASTASARERTELAFALLALAGVGLTFLRRYGNRRAGPAS